MIGFIWYCSIINQTMVSFIVRVYYSLIVAAWGFHEASVNFGGNMC